jgi:SAM-dependent methyltransferase
VPDPEQTVCIACAGADVELFLDLGATALANKFLSEDELSRPEPTYPLRVGFCHSCGHVQLMDSVQPSDMFDDYLYISSASDTLVAHFDDLAKTLVERHQLGADDLVIDIGCNDASLLRSFRSLGTRTLGVDPAQNLAALVAELGIDRFTGFFGSSTADEITSRWGQASLITATNTFPHIPALDDFLDGIAKTLAPGGTFVIEAHYLVDILEQVAFDTVYHEHVSYWALGPMMRLLEAHGMHAVRAERLPLHHGQLRVSVKRAGEGAVDESVERLLADERARGVDRFDTYLSFAGQVQRIKAELERTLTDLRSQGKRLAGYGAPAKGSTLLEYLEIGTDQIEYIADRSPLKQGRFTPGTHIPIVPTEVLLERQPDYLLLLAWNFADEVMEQQDEYRRRGGRFILPVPVVRVV